MEKLTKRNLPRALSAVLLIDSAIDHVIKIAYPILNTAGWGPQHMGIQRTPGTPINIDHKTNGLTEFRLRWYHRDGDTLSDYLSFPTVLLAASDKDIQTWARSIADPILDQRRIEAEATATKLVKDLEAKEQVLYERLAAKYAGKAVG